jgi:hypothetical protein
VIRETSCSGDIAFSNFMEKFAGITDVLVMVIIGCEVLQHIAEVAKARRDSVTVDMALLTLRRGLNAVTRTGRTFSRNLPIMSLPSITIVPNLTRIRKLG